MEKRILFCTPAGDLPTYGFHDSLVDPFTQRFTKGQDIFGLSGHVHCHALHILAQNISWPATILENPRWADFEAEVQKGYPYIGISFFHVHLGMVIEMCKAIRRLAPETKIVLGSYGVMAFCEALSPEEQRQLADHVCHGEGVRFLQRLLGDADDEPVRQRLLPRCGYTVPWLDPYPQGNNGMLISGLGCPSGCDFCTTTHHYGRRRYQLLSPEQCFEEMKRRRRVNKNCWMTIIIEEDHCLQKDHMKALGELIRQDTEFGLSELGFYTFGSIRAIQDLWEPEELAATGLYSLFIGVESKFAAEGGYNKRSGNATEVFKMLRNIGVSQTGAWMSGWDWHTRENIHEDLDWFINLEPTFNQLARVCPFQGTGMFDRLKEEGRVDDVPFEEVHFYGGGMRHTNFEPHELMAIIEDGYTKLYKTWGSTQMRLLRLHLNGYEFCRAARMKELRQERAEFHWKRAAEYWLLLAANKRFAPTGFVRQDLRRLDVRYRRLFGEPSRAEKLLSKYVLYRAHVGKLKELVRPMGDNPRVEPPKVYHYANDHDPVGDECPYTVEYPHFSPSFAASRVVQAVRRTVLGAAINMFGGTAVGNPLDTRGGGADRLEAATRVGGL